MIMHRSLFSLFPFLSVEYAHLTGKDRKPRLLKCIVL